MICHGHFEIFEIFIWSTDVSISSDSVSILVILGIHLYSNIVKPFIIWVSVIATSTSYL
jgi:hypothetical protein